MLQKIQQLFNLYNRLASKVNCVCNRANIPSAPDDGNIYTLRYNGEIKQYEWIS